MKASAVNTGRESGGGGADVTPLESHAVAQTSSSQAAPVQPSGPSGGMGAAVQIHPGALPLADRKLERYALLRMRHRAPDAYMLICRHVKDRGRAKRAGESLEKKQHVSARMAFLRDEIARRSILSAVEQQAILSDVASNARDGMQNVMELVGGNELRLKPEALKNPAVKRIRTTHRKEGTDIDVEMADVTQTLRTLTEITAQRLTSRDSRPTIVVVGVPDPKPALRADQVRIIDVGICSGTSPISHRTRPPANDQGGEAMEILPASPDAPPAIVAILPDDTEETSG